MTEEDKQLISEYMGWKLSERRMIDGSAHVVNPHFFDLNDAAICVQEMQKRGEWFDFYWFAIGNSSSEALTAWLFNPDNFFKAFVEWRKGK